MEVLVSLSCLLVILVSVSGGNSVHAYKNLTVGDSLGWYDNSQKPDVDYQEWAAANNFSLGDFLIFNTDTNHSVVQTYNETTYKLCDYDNAKEKDTIQWSEGNPSNTETHDVSVAVPLLKEGVTYFFSGDYDGDQCKNGQHFKITVTHGQGLPKSTDESLAGPASSPQSGTGDDESIPDTIVPNSNFNDPKVEDDSDEDKETSGSVSFSVPCVRGNLIFVLLGLVYLLCT
ncbi:blue copper protein [Argentina anserina]|uniref:blue copper protein n=1 Tax=Argentina anserina TaxID=57926 RepID=UPI0021768821|nr:blue copper protein [Potentilla anserina]